MAKIAILPTSSLLRMEVVKRGKRRQALNGKVIGDLAAHYDIIIVGSTASDQFYEYLYNSLPLQQRSKLRLYGRSFFANQPTEVSIDDITTDENFTYVAQSLSPWRALPFVPPSYEGLPKPVDNGAAGQLRTY